MPVTAAIIVMMLTTFILPLPFYGNLQLNLIWDASGFQPLFYIVGFTIINGWIVTAFRDKPWLMVIIMGAGISTVLLGTLYILQVLGLSNGWDVLTTGGFYFTKNKVFGTIAEAQAPSRGQLFANFGPLVFIFSLGMGLASLWRGFKNRDPKNPSRLMGPASLVLAVWILWHPTWLGQQADSCSTLRQLWRSWVQLQLSVFGDPAEFANMSKLGAEWVQTSPVLGSVQQLEPAESTSVFLQSV